jgi:hypothetical protein
MLQVAEDIRPIDGRIEGGYAAHDGWTSMPVDPTTLQLRIFLGDPQSGPLAWLFKGAPLEPEAREARLSLMRQPGLGRHLHRTPTFRVALGDGPDQMFLNNSWYGSGEFFLLDANKIYTDPNGVDGFETLLVFADRRGMHPVRNDITAGMSSDELIAHHARRFTPFGAGLSALHTANAEAVAGIALSTEDLGHGDPARGSIDDDSGWRRLSDGSMVAAALMGAANGPAVIMTRNAPNAVESPPGRCGGDMLRVIAKGGCRIGERVYKAGSFVATEAGSPVDEVAHGPEGSTQLLVVSDRRNWAPIRESGAQASSLRMSEIDRILAPFSIARDRRS